MRKCIMNLLVMLTMVVSFSSCGMLNDYHRRQQLLDAKANGEAALLESESSKKVAVETAKANLESAKLNAEADKIRAAGIAEANLIIGQSLEDNRAYLDWLWIDNMTKSDNSVFYVPTENKMPIFVNQNGKSVYGSKK